MIVKLTPRAYQLAIFESVNQYGNTLVVLPTGLGKTLISLMLIKEKIKEGRCLFLTPTKPLAKQHFESVKEILELDDEQVSLVTGEMQPVKRETEYRKPVIISTPQTIRNDMMNDRFGTNFKLLIVDECHRAVGDYAYVYTAEKLKDEALIIGLTASPGGRRDRIKEVLENLFIENIEIRTSTDPDVAPYVQKSSITWIPVQLSPTLKMIKRELDTLTSKYAKRLGEMGFPPPLKHKGKFLEMRKRILAIPSGVKYPAMVQYSILLHVLHMSELLETQGVFPLKKYISKIEEKETKSAKLLLKEPGLAKINELADSGAEHPKMKKLVELVQGMQGKKMIVFAQYRDQIKLIEKTLQDNAIAAKQFVGKRDGVTRKIQEATIAEFRQDKFDVLVASSVHPDEFILVKNDKTKEVEIVKIGDFVDTYIPQHIKLTKKEKVAGYLTLSYDGNKVDFFPITHVHKHKRISLVVKVKTASGFSTNVTEDHSLFSFNEKGDLIPIPPKKDTFIKLAFKAPNIQKNNKIDVVRELAKYTDNEDISGGKVYCTISGLSQAKIRMYKSNLKVLSAIKNSNLSLSEVAKKTSLDISTVLDTYKRLEKEIDRSRNGKSILLKITKKGHDYLKFLNWFFRNCKYRKRKYRIPLIAVAKSPQIVDDFCNIHVEVMYGKVSIPRYIYLNPNLAEFFGYYVSEGHARKTGSTAEIFLAARNKEMQKRMKKSIQKGLGLKVSVTKFGVGINSQIAYLLVKYVFRCGIGAYAKEVPSVIFTSDSKCKWKFLEGYARGDGHFAPNRTVLFSVSKKLIFGLIFLLRQLGIKRISLGKSKHRSTFDLKIPESLPFHKVNTTIATKSYYGVVPRALYSSHLFKRFSNKFRYRHESSKKLRFKKKVTEYDCYDYIKDIKKVPEQPKFVYDISVKGTERFFGGLGLICLHNSIGEEGLDIPKVDSVIFYEPIPSEIRSIQRRGRAARFKEGEIFILMTEDTRDEHYHWASKRKEEKMKQILQSMQRKMRGEKKSVQCSGSSVQKQNRKQGTGNRKRSAGQTKMSDFI